MTNKIFLHIGGAKTGSTSLQKYFFSTHPQILYFGEEGEGLDSVDDREHLENMLFMDDIFYSPEDASRIFDYMRASATDGQVLIYSNADIMTSRQQTTCARRLFRLLPDAEVIVVIRNQLPTLKSYWANHGAFLKPAPPRYYKRFIPFEEWLEWSLAFPRVSPICNFFYWEQIGLYRSLWGKKKLHILLYEELVAEKSLMFEVFARILNVEYNEHSIASSRSTLRERRRNTKREMDFYSFASRYFGSSTLDKDKLQNSLMGRWFTKWIEGGPPIEPVYTNQLHERVFCTYAGSNTRLAKEWNLQLADHGYPMM